MTAFLTGLTVKAAPYLIAGGTVLIVWLLTIIKAVLWAASREREKQAGKERDSYAKSIKDVEDAAYAARSVRPGDGGMLNDPNNRDRKG